MEYKSASWTIENQYWPQSNSKLCIIHQHTHNCHQSSDSKDDVCSEVVISPLVRHGLQVEVGVKEEPEGHRHHPQATQPEEEVDGEDQELETGVAAIESHCLLRVYCNM